MFGLGCFSHFPTSLYVSRELFVAQLGELFPYLLIIYLYDTFKTSIRKIMLRSFICFFVFLGFFWSRRSKYSKAKQDSDEEKHLHPGNETSAY